MVKILRVLRVLRPLRAINRAKGLKVRITVAQHGAVYICMCVSSSVYTSPQVYLCIHVPLLVIQYFVFLLKVYNCVSFPARGPVCVRGHQDHRQHHDRHHAAAIHVRLYWSAALQGTVKTRIERQRVMGVTTKSTASTSVEQQIVV